MVLALPDLYGEFDTSIVGVSWVITTYNLVVAVAAFCLVPFARHLRPMPTGVVGVALFAAGSAGCAAAWSLEALIGFRCLQGLGGSLLLVEMTPFAMLRRAEQVAAADRAPRAGHQHFRNLASEDVLPFVRRHRLQVVEHHPATRETSNQWILLLARDSATGESSKKEESS